MRTPGASYWHVSWNNGSTVVQATSKFAAKKQAKRKHRINGSVSVRPAKDQEIPNADV